jgi:hypothetical protein
MPFDTVNRLWRVSVRRGVLGGSNTWAVVALAMGLIRLARRANQPTLVWRGTIEPGQTLVIGNDRSTGPAPGP